MLVYEGHLTKLVTQQLYFSTPYYTKIRSALMRMGCIRQLKRGGGPSPSQWELITEPTAELFAGILESLKVGKDMTQVEMLQHEVNDLKSRLSALEGKFDQIVAGLARRLGVEEAEHE